jgi:hypothetical protein
LIVVVILGVVSGSCSRGSGPSQREPEAVPGAVKIDGGVRISDATMALIGPDLSDYERQVLDDFVLTLPEYEAAYLQSMKCAEDLGFVVSDKLPPSYKSNGSFGAFYPGVDPLADSALKGCITTYTTELSLLWGRFYGPSEQEVAESRRAFAKCLNEHGAEVPEQLSPADLVRYLGGGGLAAMPGCQKAVEAEFGFGLR